MLVGTDLTTDIKCELKAIDNLAYTFDITFGKEFLQKAVESYVHERYKNEQPMIDGFMKGKAPYMVVRKHYALAFERSTNSDIRKLEDYVLVSHIQNTLNIIAKHYDLKFIAEPKYLSMDPLSIDQDYHYSIKIDIEPEIPSVDISKVEVDLYKVVVNDKDVDDSIDEWCEQNYRGVKLDTPRPIQNTDMVTADIMVKGSAEPMNDVSVMIGSGKFVPEFEQAFIGKNIGDKFQHQLPIPKDFHDKTVAGKMIQVTVTIKNIQASKHFERDEYLFQAFNTTNEAACRDKIRHQLAKEGDKVALLYAKKQMLTKVAETLDIQIPETVLDNVIFQQINALAQTVGMRISYPVTDEDKAALNPKMQEIFKMDFDTWYKDIAEKSKIEAKGRLFLLKYSQEHNIQVTKAEVDQAIAYQSANFPGGLKDALEYYEQDQAAKQRIINKLYEDKLIDEMFGEIKKKTSEITIQDLHAKFRNIDTAQESPVKKVSTKAKSTTKSASSSKAKTTKAKTKE